MSARVIDRWKWACTVAAPGLSSSQRAVLQVLAAHAPNGSTIVGQDVMAQSAGMTDRNVRKVLDALALLGVIAGEPRPGKTTVWTVNFAWTPEPQFQGRDAAPRNSGSGVAVDNPGTTPERPRNPSSDERGSKRTSSHPLPTEARDVEGEIEFDPRNIVSFRRLAA